MWPSLTALTLRGCSDVDDETVGLIARSATTAIVACRAAVVIGAGVRLLAAQDSLCRHSMEELLLEGCSATFMGESVLQCVQWMAALTALQLPQCYYPAAANAEQLLLAQVLSASRLAKLELTEWTLTDDDIGRASERVSARLQFFTVRSATFSRSLSFLNNAIFSTLTSLTLEGVDVRDCYTNQAQLRLASLRQLSLRRGPQVQLMLSLFVMYASLLSVDVSFCQSVDYAAWLTLVAHCPSLATLHAQSTPIPHTALTALATRQQLHTINLFQSTLAPSTPPFFSTTTLCLITTHWHGYQRWKTLVAAAHTDVLIREKGEELNRLGGGSDCECDDEEWQPMASDSDRRREDVKDERKRKTRLQSVQQMEQGEGRSGRVERREWRGSASR